MSLQGPGDIAEASPPPPLPTHPLGLPGHVIHARAGPAAQLQQTLPTSPLQMPSGDQGICCWYWGAAPPRQPLPSRDVAAAACILEEGIEALRNELRHKIVLSLWHQRCWCLQSPAPEGGSLFSALKSPWCLWDGWSCQKIDFFFGRSRHGIPHQHCEHQISWLYLAICFGGLQCFVQAVQKQTESTTQCKNVPQPTSSPKGLDGKFIGTAKQNSKKKVSVTPLTHHMASENHTFLTGLANAG